jgi:uncharacterized membrane protein YtjA (UPF0391 family)
MYRTIVLLGVGVVCLVIALIAVVFDFRIASDESWNAGKVVFVSFLALGMLTVVGVYIGRRREIRSQKAIAAQTGVIGTPR